MVQLMVLVAALAGRFDDAKIKTEAVGGSVHALFGVGGNIGVSAGPDGILMVDDQFAPLAPKIRAALKALGSDAPRFLLNTHWHGDHTGGNAAFSGSVIVAHHNVRVRMLGAKKPEKALPVVTYADGLSIHFNGEAVVVKHLPGGHTDGDSVVHFTRSGVWHLGDLFFNGRFPYVDLSSGGNVVRYLANVDALLGLVGDSKLIPGHGPLAGRAELQAFRDVIDQTLELVRARKAAGKTLKQAQAEGLPKAYASWGVGFVDTPKWIEQCYRSL